MREYLISVTAMSIICSSAYGLFSKKSPSSAVIKLICGIILSMCVVSPVLKLSLDDVLSVSGVDESRISQVIAEGEARATGEQKQHITEQVAAYIRREAAKYDYIPELIITLSESAPYVPTQVQLTGSVSPYAKRMLTEYMTQTLGITGEALIWKG